MPVNSEREDYKAAKLQWDRLRDCNGGRDAVLKTGSKYVPDLPGADTAQNKAYRERGNFLNATQRTVQGLTGAIFQKPPVVDVDAQFDTLLDDITLSNVTFEMFASDAGREVMLIGRYGILVDMPAIEATDNRPYLVGYCAEDIINWTTSRYNGDDQLTMVVLRECVELPNPADEFDITKITQYRVLKLVGGTITPTCVQQLYRELEPGSGKFTTYQGQLTLMRRGTALDFVPFVFIGSNHATPDLERPPLLDMADVNLGHWRNSVDYEYGLHLVALPTPWVSGVKAPSGSKAPMKIGPSVVWELDVAGKAGMLEFTGQGLKAILDAMEQKQKQMASLGARLLEEPVSRETATAITIRHSGENASLRSIAASMEQGFSLTLRMMIWWAGAADKPNAVSANVELNKEYFDTKASSLDIQAALQALQANEISFQTWYNLLVTGGWARDGVSPEQELLDIQGRIDEQKQRDAQNNPPPTVGGGRKQVVRGADGKVKYQLVDGDSIGDDTDLGPGR